MLITSSRAATPRRWLAAAAAAGGWRERAASLLLVLDALGAVGFAAGLACAVARLPEGRGAAAPWLGMLAGAVAARGLCAWVGARCGAGASARARAALRRRAVLACLGQPPGRAAPDLMSLAIDAVEQTDGYFARFLPAQRAAGAASLLVLAAVTAVSFIGGAILAATLVPFVALMMLAGGAAADESRRQFTALARLSSLFADRLRGLPMLLCFQAESAEADRLAGAADALRRRTMAVLRIAFISSAGLEFFAALSVALVAVYAGFSLLHLLPFRLPGHLDLPRALFMLALAPEFYAPMRRLAAAYHDRQAAEAAAGELMALESAARAPLPPAPPLAQAPRIRFSAVTVRYPGDDRAALQRLSFDAAAGSIVALLGPSGAGKSTALNLLLGLAPLSAGEILIDGDTLDAWGNLAGSIAWMGQSPVLMPGSIADNIALSHPCASASEIQAAAEQVGLHATRPGGLDDRGSALSGGERRRIALARALLKPAAILLLDEPTAHLDARAEAELIQAIRHAGTGRTILIATHSAAVAALADQVIELEGAQVSKVGGFAPEPAAGAGAPQTRMTWRPQHGRDVSPGLLYPRASRSAVLCAMVATAAAVALLGVSGWFITAAALAAAPAVGFNVMLPSAGIRLLAILRTGCRYGERVLGHDAALRATARLRPVLFRALAAAAPAAALALPVGDATARLVSDVGEIETAVVQAAAPWAAAAAVLVGAALLWLAGGVCAALFVGVAGVAVGVGSLLGRFAEARGRALPPAAGGLKQQAAAIAASAPELRAYGLEGWAADRIDAAAAPQLRAQQRATAAAGWFDVLAAVAVGVAALGALLTARHGLPMAALAVLGAVGAIEGLSGTLRRLSHRGRMLEARRRLAALGDPPAPAEPVAAAGPRIGLSAGEVLGVRGPSGCGKTTLLEQMLALRALPRGRVVLEGVDLAGLSVAAARARFAYAPQDAALIAGSVRDNLGLAGDRTESELWAALHDAGLDERVRALPQGLDSWLGDNGARLSGGERRRLALARAYLRDAPWLLLDEPTEGLDGATEAVVVDRLRARLRRTLQGAVIVSHRPAPLGICDAVVDFAAAPAAALCAA